MQGAPLDKSLSRRRPAPSPRRVGGGAGNGGAGAEGSGGAGSSPEAQRLLPEGHDFVESLLSGVDAEFQVRVGDGAWAKASPHPPSLPPTYPLKSTVDPNGSGWMDLTDLTDLDYHLFISPPPPPSTHMPGTSGADSQASQAAGEGGRGRGGGAHAVGAEGGGRGQGGEKGESERGACRHPFCPPLAGHVPAHAGRHLPLAQTALPSPPSRRPPPCAAPPLPLQVMCLPMLADTSRWLKQLSRRPQVAAPVVCLLAGCHEALRANLTAFVTQQVAAVEAYAAKATAGTRREGGGWEGGGDRGGGLGAVDALFIRGGDGAFC